MPKSNGNSRNQRNNPYQLEELFVTFHHSPAGIAWRWRFRRDAEVKQLGVERAATLKIGDR